VERKLPTTWALETTPIVKDGVIFFTGSWSVVYAMDAKTGEIRSILDPKVPRERATYAATR
jgi:glucose dehydrogenase